jgi:molybdate transport system permease protein
MRLTTYDGAGGMREAFRRRRALRRKTEWDAFSFCATFVAGVVLLFIGSAILAIVAGGVTHFGEAISSDEVLFSLRMSVVTSSISTVICVALAMPTAYALSRTAMPFKRVAEVLMELTLSLPYILLGFALLLIFSSPVGKALRDVGFAVVFEPTGIVFAQLIVNLPFAIRMVRTAFADVDPKMEFVAKTLGASSGDVFRTVILPQCRNALISTLVLTWARGMGEFGATLMLVGVTRMKTETLPGSIYLSISTGNNETAMATAMIMLILSAATLVVANVLNRPTGISRVEGGRRHKGRFARVKRDSTEG